MISTTPVHPHIPSDTTSEHIQTVAESPVVQDAIHQIGTLKAMGLASNWPPGLIQQFIEMSHVLGGFSWAQSIVLSAVIIRTAMIPLNIYATRNTARLKLVQPLSKHAMSDYEEAKASGDPEEAQRKMGEVHGVYLKHRVQPVAGLSVALVSGPVFLSFFQALRQMTDFTPAIPGLKAGGYAWFTDLTMADPYFVLPAIASAGFLAVMEREFRLQPASNDGTTARMQNFMRIGTVVAFPFICQMPAGLTLYWATNSMFTLALSSVLKVPAVMKYYDIPRDEKDMPGLQKDLAKYEGKPVIEQKSSVYETMSDGFKNTLKERDRLQKSLDKSK